MERQMDYESAYEIAHKNRDHSRFICGVGESLTKVEYGDFLLSGLNNLGKQPLGYVVQIRRGWGAFGSDMYFLREHDGKLNTHENQGFWKLSKEQAEVVKEFFEDSPEDELAENPNLTYSIKGEQEESGFIVSSVNAPCRVDSCAFAVSVRQTD